jgi:hypothetical protein
MQCSEGNSENLENLIETAARFSRNSMFSIYGSFRFLFHRHEVLARTQITVLNVLTKMNSHISASGKSQPLFFKLQDECHRFSV